MLTPAYDHTEFAGLLSGLTAANLDLLEDFLRTGQPFDLITVTRALLARQLTREERALPPVPEQLEPYFDPGGEEYGATLSLRPDDTSERIALRRRLLREAEARVRRSADATEATTASLDAVLDSMRGRRRTRSIRRYRLNIEEE